MTQTGPQRYPGASTAYWYGSKYPGSSMESNVVVWHTTEGTSLPSYDGGSMAPNFTAVPDFAAKRLVWYQHFDFDVSSRALVNTAGGVETNTLNVCQVEIVGTSDPATHTKWTNAGYPHLYTPELPDWAIRDLAAFAKWANDNHNVPLSSGLVFKAYPGSYGTSNGVRMTGSQWTNFTGHCGHQHVPENLHGDPGAFPIAAILAAAKNGTIQEDDVALTDADAKTVWLTDGFYKNPNPATAASNPYIAPATGLSNIEIVTRRTETKLAALQETNDKLVTAVATLAANVGGLDPAAIVAELKAAIEHVTIHLDADGA